MVSTLSAKPESHLVFVDELSPAGRVALQRQTAEAYGVTPFFRDKLKSGVPAPELAVIPAGRFEMGSDPMELGHRPNEAPRHPTVITQPFAIGIYPVTGDEFEQFRKDTEWFLRPELLWQTGRYPVINVRMEDIKLYLAWLSMQTGETYRLPTEAEWEYAARAGTTTPFHFGDDASCKDIHCNPLFPYKEDQTKRKWYLPRCVPAAKAGEVGMHAPNLWGLHDVHGNVWEFTCDHWTESHINANRDGSPARGGNPYWYVTKGGSWFDPAARARSAARMKRYLDELDTNLGFRVVRELRQPA